MRLAPVRLSPIFVPRIWGRHSLAPLYSAAAGSSAIGEPIGEVWLTGAQCGVSMNEIAANQASGTASLGERLLGNASLGEVWPSLPETWTGRRCRNLPRIPLLVKFLFPAEKLSVQVHPEDDYAQKYEPAAGGAGKTEMWYAISANEGAELRLGFEPGVTRETFSLAIAEGGVEACLRRLAVRAGDAFFVPAGTPHTIGAGMTLCEVQQHSDLTYRIFDYNRLSADGHPRPLHVRQALDVLKFEAAGEAAGGGRVASVEARRGPLGVRYLAACRYFAVERWNFSETIEAGTSPECFELLVTLEGRGEIECGGEKQPYESAQAWLLPAALGAYRIAPQAATSLLRTYVPDLEEFRKALAREGIDEATLARLVHA